MPKVEIVREIVVETQDKVGILAEISGALADHKVNIKGIAGYSQEGKAKFMFITNDDEEKVFSALRSKGYVATEKEVVLARIPDKVGALKEIADKIKAAGINLSYIYGTTCDCPCECCLVISSNDNGKITKILG